MSGIVGTSHSKSKVIGKSLDTAKAWVNFNGGTVDAVVDMTGVRDSFNVSSVVDGGTGDYTVAFKINMPNTDYCVTANCGDSTQSAFAIPHPGGFELDEVLVVTKNLSDNRQDVSAMSVLLHGS